MRCSRLNPALIAVLAAACAPPVSLAAGPGAAGTAVESDQGRAPFIRVLGSVQDGGFPHAACHGPGCRQARASGKHRLIASLALVLPESNKVYLFDATPDVREQLDAVADLRGPAPDGVDRAPVDGLFLSHAHMGHYLGLAFFGYEAVHTRGLPVYATPSMAGFLRDNGPWSQLIEKQNIALAEVAPGASVALEDGASVTFVRSPHRDEYSDTVGFLVRGPRRALLFVPDTDAWERWSPPIESWLERVDVALLDGTFATRDELPNRSVAEIGHPLVTRSMERFEKLGASRPQIVFIHMNHSNPLLLEGSLERAELERNGFELAAEGMEFDL